MTHTERYFAEQRRRARTVAFWILTGIAFFMVAAVAAGLVATAPLGRL